MPHLDLEVPGPRHLHLQQNRRHQPLEGHQQGQRSRELRLPEVHPQPAAVRGQEVRHAHLRPLHQLQPVNRLPLPLRVRPLRPRPLRQRRHRKPVYAMPHADKHLTNVAINMNAPTYVKRIGGKWFLDNLKNFMLSK